MTAGSDIEVVQTTGDSTTDVMSQKAVTDSLDELSEEVVGMLQPIELGARQNGFLRVGTNGWAPMGQGDNAYNTHYLIIRTKEMRYIAITPNDGGIAQVGFFKTYQYDSTNPTTTFSDIVSGRQEITNDDPIKIPSDCNYIVINGYNTISINRTPTAVKISYESNALECNEVDVSAIKENIGAVDATTGNISASVISQFNADIIIPEGATHVNFQVIKTASTYGVAFLSNDGVFISGYYNTTVGAGTRTTIDIPKHAAIFRFAYLIGMRDFDFVRFIVPIRNSVYANGIKTITPTIIDGYTINKIGTIAVNSEYCYTTPIYLRAGETIVVISSTGGYSVISQTDSNGTAYAPLVFAKTGGTNVVYEYTAWFDMYVALCYKKQNAEIYLREKRSGTYYGGMYIFSFKTIANKDIWIYKDTLFTGLKPLENYEVFVNNAESSFIKNQTKRALKFKASAGNYEICLFARDIYNEVIFRKDIQISVVNAPSVKLSSKSSFDVLFFGDSIIGQNHNKIGAEFHRYLSSDDAGGTNEDGSIQPAATNVCQSKMHLVGEMNLSNTRFQYLFKAEMAMTGKRDLPYGDARANSISYFASHNPFYNPNSSQPDEIGQDGFNKRVDFGWYFQNACGNGKYPDLIYMSIGANDIGTSDTYWSGNSVSVTVERVVAICKKMKAACDTIAGGTSEMKIKIFNHQSYPLDFASYNNLPIEQARLVQTMYYTKLYYKIISEGISDYVEFVDCASKFDIANDYDMGDVNSNSRTIKANDYGLTGGDGVHMNLTGAFNYADCLINDFLADSDFN